MLISLYIYALIKLYLIFNIYQQSHYQFRFYCKHFLMNAIFYDVFPFIVFVLGYYQQYMIITIICSIYLVAFSLFYLIARVKLKFTKRIIRLIIITIPFLAIGFIPYIGVYGLLLLEFSVLPVLALERGISYLINRRYIKKAMKKMKGYRGQVIAITGSFGKTSTKLLFQQALSLFYSCNATEKSYNTELGISLFINKIPNLNAYDYLIFEFGASHKNDIARLKKIAPPDIAVVTGIGLMHVETFRSLDRIIEEKMSLIYGCKLAILNYDCEYIRHYPIPSTVKVLSYGLEHGDMRLKMVTSNTVELYYKNDYIDTVTHQLIGTHQNLNLLAVLSLCKELNCNSAILKRGIYSFHGVKNRLELKKINNHYVLDDSFNSNYKGFIDALNILKEHDGKKILMTPGMVELGKYKKELFASLVDYIVASSDIVILIGYAQTRSLYFRLKEYAKEVYMVRNFMEGYALYLAIIKKELNSMLLIENDVPDLYRVGLI